MCPFIIYQMDNKLINYVWPNIIRKIFFTAWKKYEKLELVCIMIQVCKIMSSKGISSTLIRNSKHAWLAYFYTMQMSHHTFFTLCCALGTGLFKLAVLAATCVRPVSVRVCVCVCVGATPSCLDAAEVWFFVLISSAFCAARLFSIA